MKVVAKENAQFKKGAILVLAGIFKHGQRDTCLMENASAVLCHIFQIEFQPYELSIVKKPLIKLIQRLGKLDYGSACIVCIYLRSFSPCLLGMIFLKPRVAAWRYQRGSRSLSTNLAPVGQQISQEAVKPMAEEDDDDYDVPEEIEQVLDEILKALRDKNREVQYVLYIFKWCAKYFIFQLMDFYRYSAAKGIGRLTNRLSKDFADQVVESIMELFSLRESDMAWHGGCLALAELGMISLYLLNQSFLSCRFNYP